MPPVALFTQRDAAIVPKREQMMKSQPTKAQAASTLCLALFALLVLASTARAQTLVSGNISGTWTPAGNPYIATDNCTVPSGQTLTIQPGVIVWIGENLSINAIGLIQALGTPSQRITFQAPISSQYWSNIFVIHQSETNRFKYCDFRNVQTAISMGVYGNSIMNMEIMNCTFSNCVSQAIYGQSTGIYGSGDATLRATIKNCVFTGGTNGCVVLVSGQSGSFGVNPGYANLIIIGNIFQNLTGTAFLMEIGINAGAGNPVFLNNTIVNCWGGVNATDPWDARVQDNIFVGATNAVKVSGALTRAVSYNNFYGNATNFTGLPANYGQVIFANRNGTPSDLLYNIFQDSKFVATDDLHLQSNSACIDAGTPDWAFTDMCFPPSQGSGFPDLGAYGGPDACSWLDVVPVLPVTVTLSRTNEMATLSWGALPRSTYRIQYTTNLVSAGTNLWLNLTDILATDKPASLVDTLGQTKKFYRVQSLGRTPGN
jgi:hypothetical protein